MPRHDDSPSPGTTTSPRSRRPCADDMIDISSLADGDIVAVTTENSVYTFAMIDVSHRRARLWVASGGAVSVSTFATLMGSVFAQERSTGFFGRICLGLHLELHTHRERDPEFVVLCPCTTTSIVLEIRVNGDVILPRPVDAAFN